MMIIGYFIIDIELNFAIKFPIMILGTFFGSWFIYEFGIRKWKFIRPFFGLK